MDQLVQVRATRQFVQDALRRIPAICAGQPAYGTAQAQRGLLVRLGVALLERIHTAFVVKARGGTDDCGLKWKALSPSTIAYSRRHPGVKWPPTSRAPFAPSWMLTAPERKRWWALYRGFGGGRAKGRPYHASRTASQFFGINQGDTGWAAARAWNILKSEGATTLIGQYGHATSDINGPIEILRDSGLLLNSLSPALPGKSGLPLHVKDQVFRLENAAVVVGTNRPHASVHHEGKGHVPQRRLWPAPSRWTSGWWNDLKDQARQGIIDIALALLSRRAS
jgi:hypothetical protein